VLPFYGESEFTSGLDGHDADRAGTQAIPSYESCFLLPWKIAMQQKTNESNYKTRFYHDFV
jgi:hypothetical protein